MTWHINCLAGPTDTYQPDMAPDDRLLLVPFDIPDHPDALQTSVPDILAEHGLTPTDVGDDFLRAAIGAYTGDIRISRADAYDGWTRDLVLHVPVRDPSGWTVARKRLEDLLAFLTGDHWRAVVRAAPKEYQPTRGRVREQQRKLGVDVVSLFSGGLDSFIGALDALANQGKVALVGHHAAGQGPTSSAQQHTLTALRATYSIERAPFVQFWLSPPKGTRRASETTTRGRSILFLALGVMVASCAGQIPLLVPENGFISLNVPLTPSRAGSLSTRTTHPHFIELLRRLISDLSIGVPIVLPYRFSTKGEMLVSCADQATLTRGLPSSMSCAHPGVGRFVAGGSPNQHCGYCFPCLIRRAGIATFGNDPTGYMWTDLGASLSAHRGADLRAVRLALNRWTRKPPSFGDILTSGPIPGTPEERERYLAVFTNGLAELRRFVAHFG